MTVLQAYFVSPQVPIYAVILQERHRLPKIRACIDYWAEWVESGAKRQAGSTGVILSKISL